VKNRITSIVLTGALGLGGVATGVVLAPAMASAATGDSTATTTVSDRLTKIKEVLSGLVSDGTINQAQADKVATTLDAALPRGGGHHGGGPGGGRGGGRNLETAASALGTTVAELRTALEGGKSLADVASSKGVSKATLTAKLVEAAKARLAEKVTAGDLTQAQADARVADLTTRVTAEVERKGLPARPEGRKHAESSSTTTS
jgi:polyhydroxyalkanoate synthesis regulator phasin